VIAAALALAPSDRLLHPIVAVLLLSGFGILVVAFFRSDVWFMGSRDRGFIYRVLTGIRESGRRDSFAFRQEWIKNHRPADKDLRVEDRPWNRRP
jgi:hypothetical protein